MPGRPRATTRSGRGKVKTELPGKLAAVEVLWKRRIAFFFKNDWHRPYRERKREVQRCLHELQSAMNTTEPRPKGKTLCEVFAEEDRESGQI